jgi:hypothetical protein
MKCQKKLFGCSISVIGSAKNATSMSGAVFCKATVPQYSKHILMADIKAMLHCNVPGKYYKVPLPKCSQADLLKLHSCS